VFVDEHPDSIEDGFFINTFGSLQWNHLPASHHNNGGTFSFADGHTEIHRWQSGSTLVPAIPNAASFPIAVNPNDTADFDWVMKHTSAPKN
jgi:prepilin-type processing-associated H-X9-DG protein